MKTNEQAPPAGAVIVALGYVKSDGTRSVRVIKVERTYGNNWMLGQEMGEDGRYDEARRGDFPEWLPVNGDAAATARAIGAARRKMQDDITKRRAEFLDEVSRIGAQQYGTEQ